jgi:hypothetical protein
MAFTRCADRDPNHEITLDDELLQIFVTFYWILHQGDGPGAEIFLQGECKKRGYSSFAYSVTGCKKSTRLPESNPVRLLVKKKRVSSHRASVGVKRELLRDGSQDRPRNEIPPTSVADCLTASGLPQTKRAFAIGHKTSRRSKRGKARDTHKAPLPDQPHGRFVGPTSTGSTFEKIHATTGVETNHHHLLSETPENLEYQGAFIQDACHPSQSRPPSLYPLKNSSCSQSSKIVCPVVEEMSSMPYLSDSNGQHLSFPHILHQDETGGEVTSCPESFSVQVVDDTKPVKIEDPTADVYRCKPPLDNFPPIWAQVILSLERSIDTNIPNQSRQEVCESFEWFRSYQGGVYFNNNIVKGYLLSAYSSS